METTLLSSQQLQIQSFWNLIQASDDIVQRELLRLLNSKYASLNEKRQQERSSFFSLKGALKSKGDVNTDKKMIDDYLKDKYNL
jgi:hypothetical protein